MDKKDILKYEKLVYSIIKRYNGYSDKEDLYQAGMTALLEAYKNYNKEKSTAKFSSYAYFYIIGEISKCIRDDKTFKLSREYIRMNKVIEEARDTLRQQLCREPSDMEISLYTDIDYDTMISILDANHYVQSLDEVNNLDMSYYNSVKVYDYDTNSEILDLNNELEKLDTLEKQIIYDRYYNGYTQSEISKSLGISQVQVSRKETKVLQKLKVRL